MTTFLTGFPGFLGSALLERLLARGERVDCLVQPKFREEAESRAAEVVDDAVGVADEEIDDWRECVTLHDGDVTDPTLGLDGDTYDDLRARVDEAYHLAAVYDLGVGRDLAEAVNVDGTRHVLDFVDGAVDRFHYVSTCYVSGRYDGLFTESMLEAGQSFNNHYEETKYRAEVAVQERMRDGLTTTIYRPAIAVGDSRTGATQKYDGPYYLLQLLLRQPRIALTPRLGDPDEYEVNLVPRDFVVDAVAHLSALDDSADTVYQLCDPSPPTVRELTRILGNATGRRVVSVPLTTGIVKRALKWPVVDDVARVEPETMNYFTLPTRYTCSNTVRDLAGSDIECPPFEAYVDRLVEFFRDHPEIDADAMV